MYKSYASPLPALTARFRSYCLLTAIAILLFLVAGIPPAAGDTISCPSGYTCTSCGGDLCIVCPSTYYCLEDVEASAQLTNPEKLGNWPCGYESGIDRMSKFCYREAVKATPPVAKITPGFVQHIAPVTVHFTAAESYSYTSQISSYSWNFGDGQTGSGITASHTYENAGTYSPALTVTDTGGQTDTAYGTIIVSSPAQGTQVIIDTGAGGTAVEAEAGRQNQQPLSVFSATPNYGTPPLAVSFDGQQSFDPDGSIAAYSWDFGDGTSGAGYVATHTYGKAGTFAATLTVTDNSGSVSPPSYATITITESEPVQPATTAESGKPGITLLISDPDYSNADFMQPDSAITVIPREYRGSVAVAGGTLKITGSNFGDRKGTVKMLLDEDIEAYSLDRPYGKMDLAGTKDTPIWVGIDQWSDNEISLSVMDISTLLRANFGGGKGKIYVTLPDGTTSNPYTFYLSPKWQLVTFSGAKYFNPSHNENNMNGFTSQVIDHTLFVKHDPRCKDNWGTKQGDTGRDDFFREDLPLPPNVKFSKIVFTRLDPDVDPAGFVIGKLKDGWDLVLKGDILLIGPEVVKTWVLGIFAAFDHDAGSYHAAVTDPRVLEDPSLLTYERELMIEWKNTCFSSAPYDDKDLSYAVRFSAYVPEGVDLGE